MANLTFIPQSSGSAGSAGLTLEDIPEDVRKDAEEVYAALKSNPGRMRVSFDSLNELNTYITQLKTYCEVRPAGAIRFRKSPTRNLPKTTMEFRITDIPTDEANGTTEAIRETVEEVKATAAGKTSTK